MGHSRRRRRRVGKKKMSFVSSATLRRRLRLSFCSAGGVLGWVRLMTPIRRLGRRRSVGNVRKQRFLAREKKARFLKMFPCSEPSIVTSGLLVSLARSLLQSYRVISSHLCIHNLTASFQSVKSLWKCSKELNTSGSAPFSFRDNFPNFPFFDGGETTVRTPCPSLAARPCARACRR